MTDTTIQTSTSSSIHPSTPKSRSVQRRKPRTLSGKACGRQIRPSSDNIQDHQGVQSRPRTSAQSRSQRAADSDSTRPRWARGGAPSAVPIASRVASPRVPTSHTNPPLSRQSCAKSFVCLQSCGLHPANGSDKYVTGGRKLGIDFFLSFLAGRQPQPRARKGSRRHARHRRPYLLHLVLSLSLSLSSTNHKRLPL